MPIQDINILIVVIAIVGMVFLVIWISFIAESKIYQTYLYNKRIKRLMGNINTKRLEKKRILLREKLLALQIINTRLEPMEEAEKFLGIELQPIVFEDNVIAHEVACMKFTDKKTMEEIEAKIEDGIIPIRMHFGTPINGVDEFHHAMGFFEQKYPPISCLELNLFLSPLFMDTLLTKKIILLEIVYLQVDYNHGIEVLLIPYQRKRYSSTPYNEPINVDELVK